MFSPSPRKLWAFFTFTKFDLHVKVTWPNSCLESQSVVFKGRKRQITSIRSSSFRKTWDILKGAVQPKDDPLERLLASSGTIQISGSSYLTEAVKLKALACIPTFGLIKGCRQHPLESVWVRPSRFFGCLEECCNTVLLWSSRKWIMTDMYWTPVARGLNTRLKTSWFGPEKQSF